MPVTTLRVEDVGTETCSEAGLLAIPQNTRFIRNRPMWDVYINMLDLVCKADTMLLIVLETLSLLAYVRSFFCSFHG